ncbi:C2H2-type zinc finger protein [Halorhabdus sp. CBA1104]|uniref:C2H2-type zinc finger protein n=1 Tax=Halorhabdus sp. CBA1104 TaxID=1380432 RepID=UPI0012B212C8|nr:C2H2-type zinc finger protein [Halorhabdus sp. CBA1104]QGN06917.1 C2H2-type zinc finger protein [Halorhabdus sp. CBA1104]
MSTTNIDEIAFDVPEDAEAHRCPECGRPFVREELLALHRGYEHPDALEETATAAFEEAYESENDQLAVFRLEALLALIVLYFLLLMTYALV